MCYIEGMMKKYLLLLLVIIILACGGGGGCGKNRCTPELPPAVTVTPRATADYSVW